MAGSRNRLPAQPRSAAKKSRRTSSAAAHPTTPIRRQRGSVSRGSVERALGEDPRDIPRSQPRANARAITDRELADLVAEKMHIVGMQGVALEEYPTHTIEYNKNFVAQPFPATSMEPLGDVSARDWNASVRPGAWNTITKMNRGAWLNDENMDGLVKLIMSATNDTEIMTEKTASMLFHYGERQNCTVSRKYFQNIADTEPQLLWFVGSVPFSPEGATSNHWIGVLYDPRSRAAYIVDSMDSYKAERA
jgi:hypothetical protein